MKVEGNENEFRLPFKIISTLMEPDVIEVYATVFFKCLIFLVRVNELHCSVKPLKLCSMETIFLLGY